MSAGLSAPFKGTVPDEESHAVDVREVPGVVCIPGWVRDFDSFNRWTLSDEYPDHGRIDFLNGDIWIDLSDEIENVRVPAWVRDFDSFCRWTISDEFPEEGHIDYINGNIWVEIGMEAILGHNRVKWLITYYLTAIILAKNLGRFFPDGARIVQRAVQLSREPDGAFATWETMASGRLRLSEGQTLESSILEGTPDMVLEIVSNSSVHKDTENLFAEYWKAGVAEYWLIDARSDVLRFDLYRHTQNGYLVDLTDDYWSRSLVFGQEFRLIRSQDQLGQPEYTLEARPISG